jgi:hypothetical protein
MYLKGKIMTGVQGVNAAQNKPLLRGSNTGYMALAGMGLTTAAGICKNKTAGKYHKPLGYITAALTLLHLGVILHNRNEWKKMLNEAENINKIKEGEENK